MSENIHEFRRDLAFSHEQADQTFWREVYDIAFKGLRSAVDVRADGWAQRGGIDRVLTLETGRTITVDEKVRRESYPDIALEYWSNFEKRTPGWAFKDLACDYIAYAFLPTRTCYLFPTQTLQRAVRENKKCWWGSYKHCEAKNPGYTTISVAVPIPVLMQAMSDAMRVSWSAEAA